ncbi:hypothetical protein L9F63_023349, partial [Diploptera punctata]
IMLTPVFISNMSYIHLTNLMIRYKARDSSWGLLWHSLLHADEQVSCDFLWCFFLFVSEKQMASCEEDLIVSIHYFITTKLSAADAAVVVRVVVPRRSKKRRMNTST